MVIKFESRYRINTSLKEYYLQKAINGKRIYRGWYTLKELSQLPECKTSLGNIFNRMFRDSREFKNIWDVITYNPVFSNEESIQDQFNQVMQLWPTGSLAHTVR